MQTRKFPISVKTRAFLPIRVCERALIYWRRGTYPWTFGFSTRSSWNWLRYWTSALESPSFLIMLVRPFWGVVIKVDTTRCLLTGENRWRSLQSGPTSLLSWGHCRFANRPRELPDQNRQARWTWRKAGDPGSKLASNFLVRRDVCLKATSRFKKIGAVMMWCGMLSKG